MDTQDNIYLIGLMGVGKSTIGKKLARHISIQFMDCDQELERQLGASINLIFDIEGEAGFRARETKLLHELDAQNNLVIATGGGVVTKSVNRKLLKQRPNVFYLYAPVELLWSRLRHSKNRPLLNTPNPKQQLSDLLTQRDTWYREVATDVINVQNNSINATIKKIQQCLPSARLP